jgi:hypothetical protein
MIVQASDCDYKVVFSYKYEGEKPYQTNCIVYKVHSGGMFNTDGVKVSEGMAVCDTRDQFVKEDGRKVSMTKALKKLNKKDREKVWAYYFCR